MLKYIFKMIMMPICRILDKVIDGTVAVIRDIIFQALNSDKAGEAFAVLNEEKRSSKVLKEATNSLSFSLILFCIGLIAALIYLLFWHI